MDALANAPAGMKAKKETERKVADPEDGARKHDVSGKWLHGYSAAPTCCGCV